MSRLSWKTEDDGVYEANALYRNMMFAELWDSKNLCPRERMVVIMIYRQTIHFKKRWDRISIPRIMKITGMGRRTVGETIERLEGKAVIRVERSTGGNTSGSYDRFHNFAISEELEQMVFWEWKAIMDGYQKDTQAYDEEDYADDMEYE